MFDEMQPIREWPEITPAQFTDEVRPLGQPAVFRGIAAHWPLVERASDSASEAAGYLTSLYSGAKVGVISLPPGEKGRIFYNQGLTGFNFGRSEGDLATVLTAIIEMERVANPPGVAVQAIDARTILPRFEAEHPMPLAEAVSARLWIGNATIVAPHYDLTENVACVAAGRRRFYLFPPEQLPNLYVGPMENTPAGAPVSMVSLTEPELDRFPRYREAIAAGQVAELGPGDAIYIPYMWWHGVQALEPFNVLVNYWWNDHPPRSGLHPATALLAAWLALMDMPEEHRRRWRDMFEHYVFGRSEETMAHLPPHARGLLGEIQPGDIAIARKMLAQGLE